MSPIGDHVYAIYPVTIIDGRFAVDTTLTGVHSHTSAEAQDEARAYCHGLYPTAIGTVREYIGADDGLDGAVYGPSGELIGWLDQAPRSGAVLSLPPGHSGHAYCG